MKSCPTCHRQYADGTMKFCLDDGSLLVEELAPTRPGSDAEATLHLPPPAPTEPARGRIPTQSSTMTSMGYQPVAGAYPGSQLDPERSSSRAWLWVIVALIIGGSGIAIALIVMRGRQAEEIKTPTSIPSPSPALNGTESKPPPNVTPDTRPRENPTPLSRATPLMKPTPAKAEIKEQATPPPAPRGPVSGGVMNGKAVRLVQPAYPPAAKAVHASGTVTVQVLVDENGNVVSANATSGHPLLRAAAANAARSSKFSPTKISGQPVKVNGVITYNFVEQ